MISVRNVSKSFGRTQALSDVSFEIKRGEVVGFLGPNGAGKTTMMRLITGLFQPTEGSILIDGQDLVRSKLDLKKQIGYLAEANPLYQDMTTRAFLEFVAVMKGISKSERRQAIEKTVEQCGLSPVYGRIIQKISKGFQQRLGLAQALLGDPNLLILDEPTNGLDPQQITEIRTLIQTLRRDRTILLSTHILPEVQVTCRRVLILNHGRLVASGSPEALEGKLRDFEEYIVTVRGTGRPDDGFLSGMPDVLDVQLEGVRYNECDFRIRIRKESPVRSQIARKVLEAGFELLELKSADWSLEDIFLKIVTREESPMAASSNLSSELE